jgi:serine/threonine protein phosphatase PrpC
VGEPAPTAPAEGNGVLAAHGTGPGFGWALRSEPGEVRPHNEDYAGAFVDSQPGASGPGRGPLWVVCDGLGGHAAGEIASRTAVEAVIGSWAGSRQGGAHQAARAATRAANLAVYDAALAPGRRGMATTLTALTLAGREAVISHVGDSRAYLVRDGECTQLTSDHSRVGEMLRMGLITSEQAAVHPSRSQLTRTVGTDINVQVDIVRTEMRSDDVLVLCSDGLWDVMARHEIGEATVAALAAAAHHDASDDDAPEPVAALAGALVETALARRSPDNVTVLVVRVTDEHFPEGDGQRSRWPWGRK